MAVLIALLLSLASSANVLAIDQISHANQTLRGEQAVHWLRANGTYDSLMLAMQEAKSESGTGGQSFISQTAKVFGEDAGQSTFGHSISVFGDTAVVGAYLEEVNGETFHGSAYVFVRNGNAWTRQARLLADDGRVDDRFGSSVAIWNDTIVVGAMGVDLFPFPHQPNQGAAYVFARNGGVWTQQVKLAVNLEEIVNLGVSVDISGDTVIAGTQGFAYVFIRSGNAWTQQARLVAADGAGTDRFGWSVAVENDTAIIGAYQHRVGNNNEQGAAYVFVRNGTAWTQQAKLTAADGVQFENFGWSVGLSGDTAVVGVFYGNGVYEAQGSVYVFVRNGSAWTQQAKLLAADGLPYENFGWSVAVSGDLIIVGSRLANLNSNLDAEGAAYAFTRTGETWTQRTKFFAADAAELNGFGASVAISGNTVVVGADSGTVGNNPHQGAAYVFAVNAALVPISVSRKMHGAAPFDIDLPLTGPPGIECRSGGASSNHQIILSFPSPVSVTSSSVTTGIGSVSNFTVNGSQVTVDLTGVGNAQTIVLTLFGVSNGVNTSDVSVPMGVLIGDTNASGGVNASDIGQTKAESGQPVSVTNFRTDINTSGAINATDIAIVKTHAGTQLP